MNRIDIEAARGLLDFGSRLDSEPRAEEQLKGSVALHNLLAEHRCAYVADEVGMGKTYVALGAMALMQHFQPKLRVLIITPRENIQNKWMKELGELGAPQRQVSGLESEGSGSSSRDASGEVRPLVGLGASSQSPTTGLLLHAHE